MQFESEHGFHTIIRPQFQLRSIVFLLTLFLLSCNTRTRLENVTEVRDSTGRDRLLKRDLVTYSIANPDERSYDFHSLVWQMKDGAIWKDKTVLTQADFQKGTSHRRWVSALHSFDTAKGRAILKVAEGDAPENSPRVTYQYSWREWDIATNKEVRVVRVCADPFEPFALGNTP